MSEEILARIALTAESQFRPLVLAPGLSMLDNGKLTYQVLLQWFGDVLAEPELTDEGVLFHVQKDCQRQPIVEKSLATAADLNGPLAREYGQLKKSLFDARPVSPREQLIFSRVQLPIGNHEGSLYRVRLRDDTWKLVWCWGFQRRFSDARARLCSSQNCSQLFLQPDATTRHCSRCGESLSLDRVLRQQRSEFPFSATAAILMLASVAAATYCLPVVTGAGAFHYRTEFPGQDPGSGTTIAGSVPLQNAVKLRPAAEQEPVDSEGSKTIPEQKPVTLADAVRPQSAGGPTETVSDFKTKPAENSSTSGKVSEIPREPSGTGISAAEVSGAVPEPVEPDLVTLTLRGQLDWSTGYQSAYSRAITEHARLAILFLESTENPGERGGLVAAGVEALLKHYVRVELPLDATVDGSTDRLLAHRSFRHLGMKPGLVIVELSDRQSPVFGQVVSALPLPDDGQFPQQLLQQLLILPGGSISQRSLLLAIRNRVSSAQPDLPHSSVAPHPVLNTLANRNARFMADSGRVDLFEQERYREVLRQTFGDALQTRELMFATTESVSIQTAAEQAVAHWSQQSDVVDAVNAPATVYGLDMFQAPDSGLWFATLLVIK